MHARKITELTKTIDNLECETKQLGDSLSTSQVETNTIRKELQSKVEEILSIRRECNSQMRYHTYTLSYLWKAQSVEQSLCN